MLRQLGVRIQNPAGPHMGSSWTARFELDVSKAISRLGCFNFIVGRPGKGWTFCTYVGPRGLDPPYKKGRGRVGAE